jgi:hypothetical protein
MPGLGTGQLCRAALAVRALMRARHVDLSMTRYTIEALRTGGVAQSDPAMERARVFVGRRQNADGGFFFTTTEFDTNKAGHDGKQFRSYGTATADGKLALLASGCERQDARVVAAERWLAGHDRGMDVPGFSITSSCSFDPSMIRPASSRVLGHLITISASATFSRQACSVGCPLDGKYSIMRGANPLASAALAACSRCSLRSSEVEEMKTTGSWAMAPPILAENRGPDTANIGDTRLRIGL